MAAVEPAIHGLQLPARVERRFRMTKSALLDGADGRVALFIETCDFSLAHPAPF
jgi:hypothetical protein